jgi:hypothetical protein
MGMGMGEPRPGPGDKWMGSDTRPSPNGEDYSSCLRSHTFFHFPAKEQASLVFHHHHQFSLLFLLLLLLLLLLRRLIFLSSLYLSNDHRVM